VEQVDAIEANEAAAVVEGVGGAAPEAAAPISPKAVNRLASALSQAADALTGGQVPPIEVQVTDDVDMLPPEVFANLVAYEQAIQAAVSAGVGEAKKFTIDANESASSEAGVLDAAALIGAAAADQPLVDALTTGVAPEEGPEEEVVQDGVEDMDERSPREKLYGLV
jgi:hypothetical protein